MITGGKIKKVNAEVFKEGARESSNVNINLKNVKVEKNQVKIEYNFEIDYNPGIAKLSIEGEMYLEEKDAKQIEAKWQKENRLPDEVAADVLTALTYTGSAVGTLLAFAVNVPAPINVPRAQITDKPPVESKAS